MGNQGRGHGPDQVFFVRNSGDWTMLVFEDWLALLWSSCDTQMTVKTGY
jgi:hypothetical protein